VSVCVCMSSPNDLRLAEPILMRAACDLIPSVSHFEVNS